MGKCQRKRCEKKDDWEVGHGKNKIKEQIKKGAENEKRKKMNEKKRFIS